MMTTRPSIDVTFKLADGELVYGEFGWVTDLDFFDDIDEPIELIEERWQRTYERRRWVVPSALYDCYLADCDNDAVGWFMVDGAPQARCIEHALGLQAVER